ncbi:hypothetical protein Tco_0053705 [Tanacetum coccineum]
MSMSVVNVLNTSIPEDGGDDATVEQIRKRAKILNIPKNYRIPWRTNIWLMMHQVSCIIDKLPPSWKDFKHKKQELTLVELGIHLCTEESLRAQDNDKPKGNHVVGLQLGHVHFKRMQDMSKDGLIPAFDMDTEKCERGIECIFDENIFSSVPKPSLRIPNRTEYIGGSVVPKEVTKDVVKQPELELRKSKRNRAPKNFGPEF